MAQLDGSVTLIIILDGALIGINGQWIKHKRGLRKETPYPLVHSCH
jgi:hypothetical protein